MSVILLALMQTLSNCPNINKITRSEKALLSNLLGSSISEQNIWYSTESCDWRHLQPSRVAYNRYFEFYILTKMNCFNSGLLQKLSDTNTTL